MELIRSHLDPPGTKTKDRIIQLTSKASTSKDRQAVQLTDGADKRYHVRQAVPRIVFFSPLSNVFSSFRVVLKYIRIMVSEGLYAVQVLFAG